FSHGGNHALAAGSLTGKRTNTRTPGSRVEIGVPFSQARRRLGPVNTNGEGGAVRRGFRLGKLGFSLAGSYIGYQAQNLLLGEDDRRQARLHQKVSRQVREELGALKGPAMKLGQMLSMQTEILP